jgi:hypothetical protein
VRPSVYVEYSRLGFLERSKSLVFEASHSRRPGRRRCRRINYLPVARIFTLTFYATLYRGHFHRNPVKQIRGCFDGPGDAGGRLILRANRFTDYEDDCIFSARVEGV